MPSQGQLWGRELDHYSQNFDPRTSTISEGTVTTFYNAHGIPPLAALENIICTPDVAEKRVEIIQQRLTEVTNIFQRYTVVNKAKIFNNYYGFLCMRQILYLTCLTVSSNPHPANRFYHSLDLSASYQNLTHIVALEVMEEVGEEFARGRSAETILLMDRDSFLTLCARGLLPGCPLLIFTLYAYGPRPSEDQDYYILLKDLSIRQYLVGSNRDRQLLEGICEKIFSKCKMLESWEVTSLVPSRDSRTISQAYAGLLAAFQQNLADIESLSVNMAGFLSDLALNAVGSDPSATVEEICNVIHCTLEYFWLIVTRPCERLVEDQRGIRYFVSHIFTFIQVVAERQASSRREKHCFALMFTKSDIISLVGRILLLTIQQETRLKETALEYMQAFVASFIKLQAVVAGWVRSSPELFHDSQCDWTKLVHLLASMALGRIGKPLAEWHIVYVREMVLPLLDSISPSFLGGDFETQACAYPRCFPISAPVPVPGAGYWCRKCGRAAYCGPKCQLAHWNMESSESHRLECEMFHVRE